MKTVVGTLLNFRGAWAAVEPAMHREPHHRPPQHPVLYLKPANTWAREGDAIVLAPDVLEVEVGVTLGIVIGRTSARVREADALTHVAGYCVVNDVTVPHTTLLRPPMKHKCRDGFCPIGPMVPAAQVEAPQTLRLRAYVNGQLRTEHSISELIRPVARLLAEVTEFMTLQPGDLLLMGVPDGVPRARAGDKVTCEIEGIGRLSNPVVAEAPMQPRAHAQRDMLTEGSSV